MVHGVPAGLFTAPERASECGRDSEREQARENGRARSAAAHAGHRGGCRRGVPDGHATNTYVYRHASGRLRRGRDAREVPDHLRAAEAEPEAEERVRVRLQREAGELEERAAGDRHLCVLQPVILQHGLLQYRHTPHLVPCLPTRDPRWLQGAPQRVGLKECREA